MRGQLTQAHPTHQGKHAGVSPDARSFHNQEATHWQETLRAPAKEEKQV